MKAQEELREWYRNGAAVPKPSRATGKQDRAKQLRDERRMMTAYLKAHPVCENCNVALSEHCHHEQPRSMGGSRERAIRSVGNLTAVCRRCHDLAEGIRQPVLAFGATR